MHRTLRRFSRLSTLAAAGIAVVGSGAFVMSASYSSFSAQTSNSSNNWTSGSVKLADDDSGTALFTAAANANVKPGQTASNCITVTSSGSLPSAVKVWGAVTSTGLAPYVNLQIETGTGGGFGTCTGFTPASGTSNVFNGTLNNLGATSYANGYSANWTTTGAASESKVFRVTWTLDQNTPDAAQGKNATVALTWEAQNN
ncbi:hypothetical protein [Amnibacterium setariae]|uniref:Camelysin metallo-endopeptidase n=1 Tax=Amnibacterium setariae TaxID=2306585 RepID=A0A3A1TZD7_9MICO|nr:hypothetical protein [Amnibacterium setariae]RIX30075.1 hypothetical protein D1781_01005 [Amnibacterium setariae]